MMHVAQFTQFSTFTPVYATAAPISFASFSPMVASFQHVHLSEVSEDAQQQIANSSSGYQLMTPVVPMIAAVTHVAQPNGFFLPVMAYPVAYLSSCHSHCHEDLSAMKEPSWAEKLAMKDYDVDMQGIVDDPVKIQEQEEENYHDFLDKGKAFVKELMAMDSLNGLDFKFGIDGIDISKDDAYEYLSAEDQAQVDADLALIEQWMDEHAEEIDSATKLGAEYIFATAAINIESYTDTDRSSFLLQGKMLDYARTLSAYARNSFGINNDVPLSQILGDHQLPVEGSLFDEDSVYA